MTTAIDHAQEQNKTNAYIKGEWGAVGLTENPGELPRWMLTGPEITRITGESQDQLTTEDTNETRHHEQQGAVQKTILEQVTALVSCMEEMGNSFIEESGDILSPNINCRFIDVKDSRWDQGQNDLTHLYRRGFFREQYNCTTAYQGISWY